MATSADGTQPPVSNVPAEKQLESWLTGMNLENGYVALNTMASIDAIANLDQKVRDEKLPPDLAKIWENESKYVHRALEALNGNSLLQAKFGNTFSSAMALVPFLRDMSARKQYEELLAPYAFKDVDKAAIDKKASAWKS